MKELLKKFFRRLGYEISSRESTGPIPVDMRNENFLKAYALSHPHSYTSIEPLFSLHECVQYISRNKIPGALVECGVWKGGSAMMIAHTLTQLQDTSREIWLYDTFEGMTDPGKEDIDFRGDSAKELLKKLPKDASEKNSWCVGTFEEVKKNLGATQYPTDKIRYIQGKVEETIPALIPDQIALLRLDTDWYESTAHELEHLFPKLVSGGILIIDDYGHWKGARKAVDEYFLEHQLKMVLHRIDYSVRVAVKP